MIAVKIPVRYDDWHSRLSAYLDEVRARPFAWGRHDCVLCAAGAVMAMTGVDLAADWRGRYRSASGAARVLRRMGHRSIEALVGSFLPAVNPLSADMGDLAIIPEPEMPPALGVLCGATVAVPGPDGLTFVPRARLLAAFHLPFRGEVI